MEKDIKGTKNLSLDPIVISWLITKAATKSIEQGQTASVSEVANEILTQAMQEDSVRADVDHLRKMTKKQILKQK